MLAFAIAVLLFGMEPGNLLVNPGFEHGLDGWAAEPSGITVEVQSTDDGNAVRLGVADDQPVDWRFLIQRLPMEPGARLSARAECAVESLRDSQGAALSLWFLNEAGERLAHVDHYAAPDARDWTALQVRGHAPAGTVRAALLMVLHGHGSAKFRNLGLWRHAPPAPQPPGDATVVLSVSADKACEALIGFGAEDDGWAYNADNRKHGADEDGFALREARIAWMDPDYVRMFFWYHDWNPTLDAETFTWDTDNMRSHYRTLDLYQRLGARVNVTGVEWGIKNTWENPERLSKAIGALLEHLIVEKGYTCVRDWTLSNEPNLFYIRTGESFAKYVELHRLVKAEFQRRGLKVNVVGSDDGNGEDWFLRCVRDEAYFETADLFASHFYWGETDLPFAREVFEGRVGALATRQPAKPFIVGEFGLQDHRTRPPDKNPYMEEYPCALLAQSCFIEGLNAGVAGFSTWCMHEVYYPGGKTPMNFGLWNFADRGWSPRPIYHVVASFCRNTEAGDPVWKCASTHPDRIKGVKAGETLFWVNLGDAPTRVAIQGFEPRTLRIMTEDTLSGDRECGSVIEGSGCASFTAPPRSFGYAKEHTK
jgi:hypothetical protein